MKRVVLTNKEKGHTITINFAIDGSITHVDFDDNQVGCNSFLSFDIMRGKKYDKFIALCNSSNGFSEFVNAFIEVTPDDIFMTDSALELFDVEEISPFK